MFKEIRKRFFSSHYRVYHSKSAIIKGNGPLEPAEQNIKVLI